MLRKFLLHTCLVLSSCVLALLFCEAALRLWELGAKFPSLSAVKLHRENSAKLFMVTAGESVLAAEPYERKFTLTSIISEYFQETFPELHVEADEIQMKGCALHEIIPELIPYVSKNPDLLVIAAGNNDFLARFANSLECNRTASFFYRTLHRSKLYSFIRSRLYLLGIEEAPVSSNRRFFDSPVVCEDEWDRALDEYRQGVLYLAKLGKDLGIPVVFVHPIVNEAGIDPNRSAYMGDVSRKEEFKKLFMQGRRALEDGDGEAALTAFLAAKEIDPRFAELWYRIGKAYLLNHQKLMAIKAFEHAVEFDAFPWRPLRKQLAALYEAEKRYGAIVVDVQNALRERSAEGAVGARFFHDMHHPSLEGYNLLAYSVVKAVLEKGVLTAKEGQYPKLRDEKEILAKYNFSNGNWLSLMYTRVLWFKLAAGLSYDPGERLRWLLGYVAGMRLIDPGALAFYPDLLHIENQAQQELKETPWCSANPGSPACQPSVEPLILAWPYAALKDEYPVHISGLPSTLRIALGQVKDAKSPNGDPLRVAGEEIKEGFSMHPFEWPSQAAFLLGGRYTRFESQLGIGDEGSDKSSARCRVFCDEKLLWKSALLKFNAKLESISVPVDACNLLRLVCDDAGDGQDFDQVVWVAPRLR